MRLFIAALTILAVTHAARADTPPRFNVSAYCAANPGPFGNVETCVRDEETSRGDITARWWGFAKQRRHFCTQSIAFRRKEERSYRALGECLSETASTS